MCFHLSMKKSQPSSLRAIADLAGVSLTTVSLALRKSPKLLPTTIAKVERVAAQVGYRRDPNLSRVMSATTKSRYRKTGDVIVVVVTREPRSSWGQVGDPKTPSFRAMCKRADEYGYTVEPFWLLKEEMSEARANKILLARGTAGLVVLAPSYELRNKGCLTLPIQWDKFSAVEVDDVMTEPILNRVRHNHLSGIWRALEELELLGYRRIGLCLLDKIEFATHHRWTAGYLYWSKIRGLAGDLEPMIFHDQSKKGIQKWIRNNRIDAVIGPGVELLDEIRACGIRVPEEVGFASLDLYGAVTERVSGIDQRRDVLWPMAIDLLVTAIHRGIKGVPEAPCTLTHGGDWVPGSTCRQIPATPLTRIEEILPPWHVHGTPFST